MEAAQILSEGLLAVPVIRCFPGMRGYQTLPNRAAGLALATSASANTYGSSAMVTAGLPYDAYIVGALMASPGAGASDAYAQLGIDVGPSSGTVQTVAEIKLLGHEFVTATGLIAQVPVMLPYPVFVPAGKRIAAKVARSVATSVSYNVSFIFVPASEVRTLARVRQGLGGGAAAWHDHSALASLRPSGTGRGGSMVPGASLAAGAACASGATPAYGSYVQIAANLKYDYLITHILAGYGGNAGQQFTQCSLGIGASGAEYSICDLILSSEQALVSATGEVTMPPVTLPIGMLVPAGSRLSAKIAATGSAVTANVDVTGVYIRDLRPEMSG